MNAFGQFGGFSQQSYLSNLSNNYRPPSGGRFNGTGQLSSSSIVRVDGVEGARNNPLLDTPLFDTNEPVFYFKTAYGGVFPNVRKFRYIEEPIEQMGFPMQQNNEYVKASDLDNLKSELSEQFTKMINDLKETVTNVQQPVRYEPANATAVSTATSNAVSDASTGTSTNTVVIS